MADEQLYERIFGEFKYVEPPDELLLDELATLTNGKRAECGIECSVGSVIQDSENIHESARSCPLASSIDQDYLDREFSKLQISKSEYGTQSNGAGTRVTDLSNEREELKRLILKAKREGRLQEAKELLIRYKQTEVQKKNTILVGSRIDTIQNMVRHPEKDPKRDLKKRAVELKRQGDLAGALQLMREANATANTPQNEQEKFKDLIRRLSVQLNWCSDAAKYYERTRDAKAANLFNARKKTAEKELRDLLRDFKEKTKRVPEIKECKVSFETQEVNSEVGERDMALEIEALKLTRANGESYKLRILLEWLPVHEQERTLTITPSKTQYSMALANVITRDIRQQKFFEHRRLRLELLSKEKTLLFFTRSSVAASGYLKLNPLVSHCQLQSEVKLVDEQKTAHAVVKMSIRLQYPMTPQGPIRHEETFVYIPSYTHHSSEGCEYAAIDTGDPAVNADAHENVSKAACDLYASYLVIEQEMARLAGESSEDSQLELLRLEGKRDLLQVKVDTGQLTMQQYLQDVKQCISAVKRQCIECKRGGDTTGAKRLLGYVKLMEEEVREAENNQ